MSSPAAATVGSAAAAAAATASSSQPAPPSLAADLAEVKQELKDIKAQIKGESDKEMLMALLAQQTALQEKENLLLKAQQSSTAGPSALQSRRTLVDLYAAAHTSPVHTAAASAGLLCVSCALTLAPLLCH